MAVVTLLLSRPEDEPGWRLTLLLLLAILYLASLVLVRRRALPVAIVLGLGLLVRLPLIPATPVLSDDINRYVWDGRVTASGVNPFRHGPLADELTPLRDAGWHRINHPELPTIYPPAAQAVFAAAAQIAPGVVGLKALFVLFDLGIALLIARSAGRGTGREWTLPLYWWHPLPIVEFAWSGHVDVVGLFLLVVAFVLAGSSAPPRSIFRDAGAGAALAAAALVKFLALPAAPFVAGRRWKIVLPFLLVTAAALYLPFREPGVNSFGSLGTYMAKWRANDVLFGLFLRPGTAADQDLRLTQAKFLAAALLAGIAALVAILRVPRTRAVTIVLGSAILLSPTIHPWYVAWLLPFVALSFSAPWFYVTLAALLAYHPAAGAAVPDGTISWPRAAVLAPFVILVAAGLWRERFRSGRDRPFEPGEATGTGMAD